MAPAAERTRMRSYSRPLRMSSPIDMRALVGTSDILFITLDTLRYDAAQAAWRAGMLPTLSPYLGAAGWELRHSPGNFTYPAHHAFFAGFLPTPATPGPHPRLFAAEFEGSTSITDRTFVFQESNLPAALAALGYRTICVGGTGFFNGRTALSQVLPGLFHEAHWSPEMGVASRDSEVRQVERACARIIATPPEQRVFLFINIAAIHQPNWFYGSHDPVDTLATHTAALGAVDSALEPLFKLLRARGSTVCILCSDHGTAYGENGHFGHRCCHEVVWNVPYTEFIL